MEKTTKKDMLALTKFYDEVLVNSDDKKLLEACVKHTIGQLSLVDTNSLLDYSIGTSKEDKEKLATELGEKFKEILTIEDEKAENDFSKKNNENRQNDL